jgi:F420-dependent oxidoreductase-like protein
MKLGLQIPDFTNPDGPPALASDLTWAARTADQAGFEFLAVMDHFFEIPSIGPAENAMLESYTTLGYLAAQTEQIKLMTLVTGAIYRQPGLLGKIVTTLDVLSQGRAWLGIGAGWYHEEAEGLGLDFPPLGERFARLEETLQIVLKMWRGSESPYDGKYFHLDRPMNSPQSLTRPHPPIMIGGSGEKKTLRLVAQYADGSNLFFSPDLAHKLDVLREHCADVGRDYDSIRKSVYFVFDPGVRGERTDEVIEQLAGLAELGFDTAIGRVTRIWERTPLEIVASEVLPRVSEL